MINCTSVTIVMVDDDRDDQLLVQEAFKNNCSCEVKLDFVDDGQALLDCLNDIVILPGLILLDINMPKVGGFQVLDRIKSDPRLINIPIIVFTTATDEKAVLTSYCKGANSFISKPQAFNTLEKIVDVVSKYWCEIVSLPTSLCPLNKAA